MNKSNNSLKPALLLLLALAAGSLANARAGVDPVIARCATDANWRSITNQIALHRKKISALMDQRRELETRIALLKRAQKDSRREQAESDRLVAATRPISRAIAELELQENAIRTRVKKQLPKRT